MTTAAGRGSVARSRHASLRHGGLGSAPMTTPEDSGHPPARMRRT
jgi:hypothetical protein